MSGLQRLMDRANAALAGAFAAGGGSVAPQARDHSGWAAVWAHHHLQTQCRHHTWLDAIYAHVHNNYAPIARYDAPSNLPRSMFGILSFDVMHRAPKPGS